MALKRAFDFSEDVAIVAGAGSRMSGEIGNGRASAVLLARHGARVVLVDNNLNWVQETKRMIDNEGGTSMVIHANVSDEEACKEVVKQTVTAFGAVHILVNVAFPLDMLRPSFELLHCIADLEDSIVGVGGAEGDATTLDLKAWDQGLRTNVTSMVLMCRHAVPEMRKVGRGAIVNLSSISGLLGGNPGLLYATTKGAIVQMTRTMAAHYGQDQVRVNCVAPGMVYTPMVRGRSMTDQVRQMRIEQNLLKREGTAWDVGYAILFLCSKEARWITGLIMPVDGGTTAAIIGRTGVYTLAEELENSPGGTSKL